ncbi:MAG TPA: hypothetical protein VMU54_11255 [Planctomycetota bacterium]|nr:hypothetical protein [Planctomycetota bacterium]
MNERSLPENAFGLRWIQDDDQGRLVCAPGGGEFRSPGDAIRSLGLGCDEAELNDRLNRFPPRIRIHGGYRTSIGEPTVRFSLTWEPGQAEAAYSQTKDSPEEGMSGTIEMPLDGNLNEALKGLLIPDAEDIIGEANDRGMAVKLKDVDFWIGTQHFSVGDEARS